VSASVHEVAVGRRVRGPSAVSGDLRTFLNLTRTIAVMEFKLRFFGSALGYLWQLVRPLLLFGVLYVVFTQFVRFGEDVKLYAAILLMNLVFFTFFADATSNAVTSVVNRENLVRRIRFPRLVIPLSVVLTNSFNLMLNLIVVAIFAIASGVEPHPTWVQLPVFIAVLVAFATGISMLLSALYVRFRDIRPIWDVLVQVLFYGSPVLYVLETVDSETVQKLMLYNPIATILQQLRYAFIDPSAPSAGEELGGWVYLLIPGGIVVVTCLLGLWVFNREAPRIAEDL